MAEPVEKLDKSCFARELRAWLRVEIGAGKFDPNRFWAALNFPRPYGRVQDGSDCRAA